MDAGPDTPVSQFDREVRVLRVGHQFRPLELAYLRGGRVTLTITGTYRFPPPPPELFLRQDKDQLSLHFQIVKMKNIEIFNLALKSTAM